MPHAVVSSLPTLPKAAASEAAQPVLARLSYVLAWGFLLFALLLFCSGGWQAFATDPAPRHAIVAGVLFLLAGELARRHHTGLAAACIGAGLASAVLGFAVRPVPLGVSLVACGAGAILARGAWGERELRRRLNATEESAAELRGLLEHALRVGTAGDLAALVAHQVRNQLQLIDGEAVLAQLDGAEGLAPRLRCIREATAKSADLMTQLLTLAHPGRGEVRHVDLSGQVVELAERLRGLLPQSIGLAVEPAIERVTVALDPRDLEHAVLNLVINAKHAMPDGGELVLTVRVGEEHVALTVRDTGCGIPPAMLEHVCKPYVTTKPRGEGTGLGLAAVRRFVEEAGGTLRVQSALGEGSAFEMRFPIARADGERDAGAAVRGRTARQPTGT